MKIMNGSKPSASVRGNQLGVAVRNDKDKLSGKQGGKDGKVTVRPPSSTFLQAPRDQFDARPVKPRKPS